MRITSKTWNDTKLILIQWVIFALILSTVAIYVLYKENEGLKVENSNLRINLMEIEKQYGQKSIILKLQEKK